ncbi:MAG: TonB-dependent receptor [Alistipes putredinis]|nr:MAG: TonB-dependent receptor [Alistipes putredinis]
MYRSLNTSAPVTFKRDGIKDLIEDNINRGIRSMFPSDSIDIEQERFDISSRFSNPSAGAALFHTSTVRLLDGRLELCAGVRLDYEYSRLRYDSRTSIDYRFTYTMADYKSLETLLRGRTSLSYFEVLPKFTVLYSLGGAAGNVFLSAAKGYRAGGFNIQMFSDILQNRMRDDMMSDLGLHMGGEAPYDVRDIMSYRPEYCWNYEAGAHLNLIDGTLRIDASAFYIDCRDQQITVFPAGTTTGRMMRNAGRTRSAGAELAVDAYPCRGLRLAVSYGYTNAKFVDYHDGKRNYNGNHVPYAPQKYVRRKCRVPYGVLVGNRLRHAQSRLQRCGKDILGRCQHGFTAVLRLARSRPYDRERRCGNRLVGQESDWNEVRYVLFPVRRQLLRAARQTGGGGHYGAVQFQWNEMKNSIKKVTIMKKTLFMLVLAALSVAMCSCKVDSFDYLPPDSLSVLGLQRRFVLFRRKHLLFAEQPRRGVAAQGYALRIHHARHGFYRAVEACQFEDFRRQLLAGRSQFVFLRRTVSCLPPARRSVPSIP